MEDEYLKGIMKRTRLFQEGWECNTGIDCDECVGGCEANLEMDGHTLKEHKDIMGDSKTPDAKWIFSRGRAIILSDSSIKKLKDLHCMFGAWGTQDELVDLAIDSFHSNVFPSEQDTEKIIDNEDLDVTSQVEIGPIEDEAVSIAKCICGAKFGFYRFQIFPYGENERKCPACGRKLYHTINVRVYEKKGV